VKVLAVEAEWSATWAGVLVVWILVTEAICLEEWIWAVTWVLNQAHKVDKLKVALKLLLKVDKLKVEVINHKVVEHKVVRNFKKQKSENYFSLFLYIDFKFILEPTNFNI
jgi:hypothetical protein